MFVPFIVAKSNASEKSTSNAVHLDTFVPVTKFDGVTATTVGAVESLDAVTVKLLVCGAAIWFPAESVTAPVAVITYCVLAIMAVFGRN